MVLLTADNSTDSVGSLDIASMRNVILPLGLYKQTPFPSEQSYDRITCVLRKHLTENTRLPINANVLLSICRALYDETSNACEGEGETNFLRSQRILPRVLNRLQSWRLLTQEEKESSFDGLAMDLAGLVNSDGSSDVELTSGHSPRRRILTIRWIGSKPFSHDLSSSADRSAPGLCPMPCVDSSSLAAQHPYCRDVHHHEYVRFRNGCCACRQPRPSASVTGHAARCTSTSTMAHSYDTRTGDELHAHLRMPKDHGGALESASAWLTTQIPDGPPREHPLETADAPSTLHSEFVEQNAHKGPRSCTCPGSLTSCDNRFRARSFEDMPKPFEDVRTFAPAFSTPRAQQAPRSSASSTRKDAISDFFGSMAVRQRAKTALLSPLPTFLSSKATPALKQAPSKLATNSTKVPLSSSSTKHNAIVGLQATRPLAPPSASTASRGSNATANEQRGGGTRKGSRVGTSVANLQNIPDGSPIRRPAAPTAGPRTQARVLRLPGLSERAAFSQALSTDGRHSETSAHSHAQRVEHSAQLVKAHPTASSLAVQTNATRPARSSRTSQPFK